MIGHTTPTAAVCLHQAACQCAICTEHRELTFVIRCAEAANWIVKPAARLRLAELASQLAELRAAHQAEGGQA